MHYVRKLCLYQDFDYTYPVLWSLIIQSLFPIPGFPLAMCYCNYFDTISNKTIDDHKRITFHQVTASPE